MQQNNIVLSPITENLSGELSDRIFYKCFFCEKIQVLFDYERKICEKLSGTEFFCTNCLRNNFHTKNNKNILPLSFRGIIGAYYYYLYINQKKLYFSQVEDFIKSHYSAGIINPIFKYDPETFLWFIDFSRVGKGGKQIPLNEILKTVVSILSCFNLPECIEGIKTASVYEKFKTACEKFHENRYRPEGKTILAPTLVGCGSTAINQDYAETRDFLYKDLVFKSHY